jgi:threonine synthase
MSNWLDLGVRVSVIFGVFGEMMSNGQVNREKGIDIAVATGSFAMPMALWYARWMGLPIRTLICGCNENGAVWDLLHRGEVDTGMLSVKTTTPEADFALPPNLERLIHASLGQEEAMRYWWSCTEGRNYIVSDNDLTILSKGMFAAVVSMDRVASIIPSVYRTNRYVLDPYGALAYGALADYRARTGSVGPALILSEKGPFCEAASVAQCMNISREELMHILAED